MDWLGLGSPPEWLSMQCQSANAAPIQCQSKPSPIRQFQSQSETNPSQFLQRIRQYYANRGPFRQNVFNQSNANRVPIQCQFRTNLVPILCQSNAIQELPILINNPIHSQSDVNSVSIPCQSNASPSPIQHQFDVHPNYQYGANLVSIQCKSNVNQKPIGYQSSSPGCQFIANPPII